MTATLAPGSALARTSRLYQSSFGASSESTPGAVAIDQSTGDVYVAGTTFSTGFVSRFTSAGAADNFTAGPDAGTNTLTSSPHLTDVAVDNSLGPLHGDVYLAESDTVKILSSDGALLGALNGNATPDGGFNGSVCGVAVDASSGDVYVAQARTNSNEPRIWRYAPNSPASAIDDSDYTLAGINPVHEICRLAADESNGRLYGAMPKEGRALFVFQTSAFTAVPAQTVSTLLDQPVTAVSVDPTNGEVYADEGNRISVFGSSGTPLYHFGYAADFSNLSAGVGVKSNAPDPASAAYVTDPVGRDPSDRQVAVFGAPIQVTTLTHPPVASIGPDGTSASVFSSLEQLAFDQAARRLYVFDGGDPHGIYGLDASSPPGFPTFPGFTPFVTAESGFGTGLAIDNAGLSSAGNIYLATTSDSLIYGFDSTGAPLGGFPIDPATTPGAPSGSPKELCGAAVDSAGHLFVANAKTKSVLQYSAAGAFLASIDTSAQGAGPCGLAFAANDDLYASVGGHGVWRYTAASGYTSASKIAPGDRNGSTPPIAVDPTSGHLFVARSENVDTTGLPPRAWIEEYDSSGHFLDEFDPGTRPEQLITGITVDPANHDLYVTDDTNQVVHVIGPGVIRPETSVSVASPANTTATLNGSVNTQGLALSDCHFEYVAEAAYRLTGFTDLSSGGEAPCVPAAGSIATDLDDHPVTGLAGGLNRNTDYRFRVSAANTNGTTISADLGFTSTGPPIVETTGSPIRTATTARLDSRVDPRAAATTFHFEYGAQGPCNTNPCTATTPASAGSADLTRLVSQQITGLQPNTSYHYRIVADNHNPDGPVFGQDMTVTTRVSDAPLEHGNFPGPPGSDRAWEQVNAPDTGGNPVVGAQGISDDGGRAVYQVFGGTPASDTGSLFSQFLAERAETAPHQGSWQTVPIHPPRAQTSSSTWNPPADNGELSILVARNQSPAGFDVWRLAPGGSPTKLLADKNVGDFYVSEDASRVVVSLPGSLDPEHPFLAQPGSKYLYDITSGTPQLVSFLPDESVPSCGADPTSVPPAFGAGAFSHRDDHWISSDGSLVYFPSQGSGSCSADQASQLYVRNLLAATTIRVSPPPLSGAACSAAFIKSTPGVVFFWSQSRLAPQDSTPGKGCDDKADGDIYRYVLATGAVDCVTCVVPGLDVDVAEPPLRTGDRVAVAGDGSRVYFMTTHHLLAGAPPEGQLGIYRVAVATGALAFVAPGGGTVIGDSPESENTALTLDGSVLSFRSANTDLDALTDSNNGGTAQYYRYDDRERSLICVSCPQDGSAPRGSAPAPTPLQPSESPSEVAPNMTPLDANGDFFFPSVTALVAADKNTAGPGDDPGSGTDVYEWRDGQLLLVSDGVTTWPTSSNGIPGTPRFDGVSPSGRDAFFTEAAQLTPDAIDAFHRLYDARVGGGFEFPVAKAPCSLEECQGVPAPTPEDPFPATLSFQGPGNQLPLPPPVKCGKGDVLRSGRCVPVPCPKKEVRRGGRCVPVPCPKKEVRRGGHCVPVPCPKKEVRRSGKCVHKDANRNRRRHTTGRPGRHHR